jgi:hypothetical protein
MTRPVEGSTPTARGQRMSLEERWKLFFELTNEATVVAEAIGDYTLAELASDAATEAADRLGLSHERVIALRQALRKRASEVPPGTRISLSDLTGSADAVIDQSSGSRKAHAQPPVRRPRARERID